MTFLNAAHENDPKQYLALMVAALCTVHFSLRRDDCLPLAAGAKVADMPGWRSRLIPDDDDLQADPSAPPVLLIDGHYLIFRSFHGMPPLSAPDGTPVGALVGFCNVINKLVRITSGLVLVRRVSTPVL